MTSVRVSVPLLPDSRLTAAAKLLWLTLFAAGTWPATAENQPGRPALPDRFLPVGALERMRRKVEETGLPLRDLHGHEALVELLEQEAMAT